MTSSAYILPLLISNAPQALLKQLAQVNRNMYHNATPRLHQKLNIGSLIAVDRYNPVNLQYARQIRVGIRAAMAITDSHPFVIALAQTEIRGLRILDLQDAKNLSDEILARIVSTQKNIVKLLLPPQAGPITLMALSSRPSAASDLTHFSLPSALYLDSTLLASIAQRHTSLQHVNVAMTKPNLSLTTTFEACQDIRYLDIRWRHAGKDHDDLHSYLEHPEYAPNLEFIAISKIHRELNSERLIDQLITHKSRTLKEVVIYNDDTLSVELVRRLVAECPLLQKLTLHHCSQLDLTVLSQENALHWGCSDNRTLQVSEFPYEQPKMSD